MFAEISSSGLLFILCNIKRANIPVELWILDFKASHEFEGIAPSEHYAEFEAVYDRMKEFYERFTALGEGGDGSAKILLLDEVAGALTHYELTGEKAKANEMRQIMSSLLMLGRSRRCYLALAFQRFSVSVFPQSAGSIDNFHIKIGMGALTTEGRKSLFSGEHDESIDSLPYGMARGIALIDGKPLVSLQIPNVSKKKMLSYLQGK